MACPLCWQNLGRTRPPAQYALANHPPPPSWSNHGPLQSEVLAEGPHRRQQRLDCRRVDGQTRWLL
eukprot:4336522-Prorocentrum_lima.AAC.1